VTEGIHNVDVLQASGGAAKGSGAIDLADAWGNGLEIAATGSVAQLVSDGPIVTATAAHVGTYSLTINYQENGEAPVGSQVVQFDVEVGDEADDLAAKIQSAIDQNSTLSGKVAVAGTASASANLFLETTNSGAQYSVRVEGMSAVVEDTQLFDFSATSDRGASANSIQMRVVTAKNASGKTATATIGVGTYTSLSALATTLNENLALAANFGTAEGTVEDIYVTTNSSTNSLQFTTRDEGSDYSIQFLTTGSGTDQAQNVLNIAMDSIAVTGTDAIVSFDNYSNRISSVKYFGSSDVEVYDSAAGSADRGLINMTVGTALNGINLGNLLLDAKAARFNVRLDGGPGTQVIAGQNTQIWNSSRSESVTVKYNLTAQGGTEDINNVDQSLVFQIGGNVGQTAKIGIRNMSSTSLAKNVAGNMFNSLSEIDVTTVQGAQDAQELIDTAINAVSTTRGTLGSFQKNTLESNLRNLRIASQNLTAAESMIRDTDMAVEMSEFTKNQILSQAGVAMLAQANQIPQVVLSLFR
jgi:flagellin